MVMHHSFSATAGAVLTTDDVLTSSPSFFFLSLSFFLPSPFFSPHLLVSARLVWSTKLKSESADGTPKTKMVSWNMISVSTAFPKRQSTCIQFFHRTQSFILIFNFSLGLLLHCCTTHPADYHLQQRTTNGKSPKTHEKDGFKNDEERCHGRCPSPPPPAGSFTSVG